MAPQICFLIFVALLLQVGGSTDTESAELGDNETEVDVISRSGHGLSENKWILILGGSGFVAGVLGVVMLMANDGKRRKQADFDCCDCCELMCCCCILVGRITEGSGDG